MVISYQLSVISYKRFLVILSLFIVLKPSNLYEERNCSKTLLTDD